MRLLRNFRAWLFGPQCEHEWRNTGATYTDSQHGFTVVLRQCSVCNVTVIIEV